MQITIQATKKGKEGDGQHGHWTMYSLSFPEVTIFEQNGTPHKFTKAGTFCTDASDLKQGDVIDAEFEINDKGYADIKSFKRGGIVEPSPAPKAPSPVPPSIIPPSKVPFDRDSSIERQVSAKIAFEHGINDDDDTPWSIAKALHQADAIYQWIHTGKLPDTTPCPTIAHSEAIVAKQGESVTPDGTEGTGVNLQFLRAAYKKLEWAGDGTAISLICNRFAMNRELDMTLKSVILKLTQTQKEEFVNAVSKMAAK